jgi:hypothetical protein
VRAIKPEELDGRRGGDPGLTEVPVERCDNDDMTEEQMPTKTLIQVPEELDELLHAAGLEPGQIAVAEVRDGELRLRRATATEEIDAELASGAARRFDSTEALDRWLLDGVEPAER